MDQSVLKKELASKIEEKQTLKQLHQEKKQRVDPDHVRKILDAIQISANQPKIKPWNPTGETWIEVSLFRNIPDLFHRFKGPRDGSWTLRLFGENLIWFRVKDNHNSMLESEYLKPKMHAIWGASGHSNIESFSDDWIHKMLTHNQQKQSQSMIIGDEDL